jgi:uncharacterized membrane protein YkoI
LWLALGLTKRSRRDFKRGSRSGRIQSFSNSLISTFGSALQSAKRASDPHESRGVDGAGRSWHASGMKTPLSFPCGLFALVVVAGFPGFTRAQEKNDGKLLIEIPLAVQATITSEKGDGKVQDFRRVNEDNGTTFIVGLIIDGKNYALYLDAAGRVMRKELDEEKKEEKPLTVEGLPAAIKKTLSREAGGAPITEIQVHEKTYAAEIKVGKRKYTIEIDADGKLLRKQYASDDDER